MRKASSFTIISFFLSLLILAGIFWWSISEQPVDSGSTEKIFFTVNKGDGVDEISLRLKKERLVKSVFYFKFVSVLGGTARKFKAGGYYLSSSMKPTEISKLLTKGINDQWITTVEGLREEQIAQLLIKNGFAIDLLLWDKEVKSSKLEGRLFPDSYLIPVGTNQQKILDIFSKNFQKKVIKGLADEIQESRHSLEEILIMASIVEREAKIDADREIIAGILWKRLESDWPLQVDASVQYALASKKCAILTFPCEWWPKILNGDLKLKSSYNTYLYRGLPPSPICSPGLASIKAVLSPSESKYWYYISGTDGKIHYAVSLEEHQQNIKKYLH